jgi:small basic protein (TIGR04137 family)
MSIHKSLATAGALTKHRNVLTRAERIEILKREGRFKDEQSVFNLPKVRSILAKAKKKTKDEAAAPAAGGAAAPAKDAAAAKGGASAKDAGAKGAAPAKKDEKKK